MTFGILLRACAALTLALRARPTVVLLDVSLPIINSIAALGSVRLFIVSAHTSESLEERARGGGREVWLTSCDHRIMHLSNSASPRNIRVLVAEDDDDFRGLVVASLREDGYDVIEARNGDELLELITPPVLFNPPDAIVADVRMPGVDGLSVTAGLRGTGWATPIILMTAHANDDVCARAKELRADGLFQKPFEMRDLRRELRRLVQGTGGWRSAAPTLPDIS